MATFSRWILPAKFDREDYTTTPINIDLTSSIKGFILNKVWERKSEYGFNHNLKNIDISNIKKATIEIHPQFHSGTVDENRLSKIIDNVCGEIPDYLDCGDYKKWHYRYGIVIIEIEYINDIDSIPTKADFLNDEYHFPFKQDFIEEYHKQKSILRETAYFFLASLHLAFPTSFFMGYDNDLFIDGMLYINSMGKTYASKVQSNAFMHLVPIEVKKIKALELSINLLNDIWHYDLWPIKRFLIAVESDQLSMDNLLDLIYALEGLFDKSTSSELVKLTTVILLCDNKKHADEMQGILKVAFLIRNDIAHGEKTYAPDEKVKCNGKEVLAQEIYWKMKGIVASMIVEAIYKLKRNKGMNKLRFTKDDLIDLFLNKNPA